MEASFYIWLARNSYGWFINTYLIIIEDANFPAVGSKNTNRSRGNPSSNTSSLNLQPLRNRRKCDRRTKHPGFFNKGNTCYANSVLQGLSTIPSFCCQSASESRFLSPLTRAVTLKCHFQRDPSNLLPALCRKLSTSKHIFSQSNTQKDVFNSSSYVFLYVAT